MAEERRRKTVDRAKDRNEKEQIDGADMQRIDYDKKQRSGRMTSVRDRTDRNELIQKVEGTNCERSKWKHK